VLFAVVCPVCGGNGGAPCRACLEQLRPAPLLPAPPGVDGCVALLAYEGAGRELVARLKYRNHRRALPGLARAAAAGLEPSGIDVVTWPPTTAARRRRRGFDQAELLARRVAAELGRPCARLLARVSGPAQTGRGAADRWAGVHFVARRAVGGRVLLVDDVVTTGATVSAGAAVLRDAGADAVTVCALARTPAKSHHAE
jgi:predicted amidophosphoribosyltransferase